MPQTRPQPRLASDELKHMMFVSWGDLATRTGTLTDTDRAANLYAVVADPYHELAFGDLSREDIALVCIYGLLEARQFDKALRGLASLHRMERDAERHARSRNATPDFDPEPAPRPARRPEPAARPHRHIPPHILAVRPDLATMSEADYQRFIAAAPPDT